MWHVPGGKWQARGAREPARAAEREAAEQEDASAVVESPAKLPRVGGMEPNHKICTFLTFLLALIIF